MTSAVQPTDIPDRYRASPPKDAAISAAGLVVSKVDAGDWAAWDRLCPEALFTTPFATSTYLRSLVRTFRLTPSTYLVSRGGEVIAGLVLCGRRYLGVNVVTGTPATQYSAYLYNKSVFGSTYPTKGTTAHIEVSRALMAAALKDYRSIDLYLVPELQDVRPWIWDGWSASPNYTHVFDLSAEPRVSHSVRKNAHKCMRSGARASTEWDLEGCWSLLDDTRSRHGVSIGMSKSQFFSLAGDMHSAGMAWMVSVLDASGRPVASRIQLAVPGSNTAFDWAAGSSPAALASGANPWNVLNVIEECRARGFKYWDMSGVNTETVAKFKGEFGGRLVNGFVLHSPRPFTHVLAEGVRAKARSMKRGLVRWQGQSKPAAARPD